MAVRSVIFDVIGRDNASKAFLSASKSAETAAMGIDRSLARIEARGARMQAFGQKLSRSITLPVVAAAAVSVDQASKFQKNMTLLQTAGGETEKKMVGISKGIMDTAKSTGTSLDQLSQGMYTVAKAGAQKWSATEQLTVLKAASQGAKAENVDLGTSVSALTSVMMSYHVSASKAVSVENMLIRGSGLAKTTMQEYAASLATVVPIASAAGISFDQIAGAIATLTQHGTSAQEATQELSNTIRNLQAPNNVAVSAMNQLGISSVDVSKNLGKRGLTGTIDMIASHLPKSGLVYLDTMKKMASGTADLTLMQSKMPPALAKVSKGFLDGTVSAAEYRKDFRGMGADGYAQGSAFLALAGKVRGYNDSVRAGTPAQKTLASQLKAIYGGATGLNTVLQLGGENMKYFKTATNEVADAAKKSGADVLGWAKTQDTFAVKVDKAKANLQVLAVEIGTALIPAVTKIVTWVSKAVTWFDNLSSGQKKLIGYSILVVAALGPVLAIVGRLVRLFSGLGKMVLFGSRFFAGIRGAESSMAGMQTRAYTMGTSVRRSFTGVSEQAALTARSVAASQDAQAAAVGAASERQMLAIAALRRQTAAMPMGTGAVPIAGAAGRGSVPVGARGSASAGLMGRAGGALMIALGGQLIGQTIDDGKKGSGRNRAGTITADAATGAGIGFLIGGPWGAAAGGLAGGIVGAVSSGKKKSDFVNTYSNLRDMGISKSDLKRLGIAQSPNKLGTYMPAQQAQSSFTGAELATGTGTSSQAAQVAKLAIEHAKLAESAKQAGLTETDLQKAVLGSAKDYQRVIAAWEAGADPSAKQLEILRQLRAAHLAAGQAAVKTALATGETLTAFVKGGTVSDLLTGKLVNLNKAHLTAAQTSSNFADSLAHLSGSVKANGATLDRNSLFGQRNTVAMRSAASAAIAHAQAVYSQTGSLKKADAALISGRKKLIDAAVAAGLNRAQVAKLATALGLVPGNVHSKVKVDVVSAKADLDNIITKIHTIGQGANAVISITTKDASGHTNTVKARAGGGVLPEGWATVGELGWEAVYTKGGKSQVFPHEKSKKLLGYGERVPGFAGGTGGSTPASRAALAKLRITIDTSDISHFLSSLTGSASGIGYAERTLANAVTRAGGGSALAHELNHENSALMKLATDRTTIASRLKAANTKLADAQQKYNDERTNVASTITGGFDITAAGFTPSQILANAHKAVADAQTLSAQYETLRKNGLNKTTLAGLEEKGLAAAPQVAALTSATRAQIAEFNSTTGGLTSIANKIGTQAADSLYGSGVQAAKGLVAGLRSQEKALQAAMKHLASVMVKQIKHDLQMHSPSRVGFDIGANFVGSGVSGMASKHAAIRRAAHGMAVAMDPRLASSALVGGGSGRSITINNTVHAAPGQSEFEIARMSSAAIEWALMTR